MVDPNTPAPRVARIAHTSRNVREGLGAVCGLEAFIASAHAHSSRFVEVRRQRLARTVATEVLSEILRDQPENDRAKGGEARGKSDQQEEDATSTVEH